LGGECPPAASQFVAPGQRFPPVTRFTSDNMPLPDLKESVRELLKPTLGGSSIDRRFVP